MIIQVHSTIKITSIKRLTFFFFYFYRLYQVQYLLDFYLQGLFLCFCIESSLGREIINARYFTFNLCGFFIQSSFGSQISNIRYFLFNLCGSCIQSSSNHKTSNNWYLVFNLFFCVLYSAFLTSPLVLGIFLSTTLIFFSRSCFSESYCVLVTNPLVLGILVAIALTLVINLLNFINLPNFPFTTGETMGNY